MASWVVLCLWVATGIEREMARWGRLAHRTARQQETAAILIGAAALDMRRTQLTENSRVRFSGDSRLFPGDIKGAAGTESSRR